VYLDRRNIKTNRPSIKLDDKRLGPFKIARQINPVAFELKLPTTMKIHPVFHVSLLSPKTKDIIPELVLPRPSPEVVDNQEVFEVEKILDSRMFRNQLQYLIHWKGYDVSDRSWEPSANAAGSAELIREFHKRYPEKPSKSTLLSVSRRKRRG
jgi:hypothetical protein